MIQRIQSIYLLLAAALSSGLFGVPFAQTASPQKEGIFRDAVFNVHDHIALLILTILVAVSSLGAIFLFNNRVLQMNVGKLGMILAFALLTSTLGLQYTATVDGDVSFGLGLGFPLLSIIFIFLANKAILKDENLVKSSDRIR